MPITRFVQKNQQKNNLILVLFLFENSSVKIVELASIYKQMFFFEFHVNILI